MCGFGWPKGPRGGIRFADIQLSAIGPPCGPIPSATALRSSVLKHKYIVGETVYFTASNVARPAASGTYEVIRLLPTDGDDCQYRIKSSTEAFERVAKESQLAAS